MMNFIKKFKSQEDIFILILAAIIGIAGGYFAIGFRYLIIFINKYLFYSIGEDHAFFTGWQIFLLFLIPVCGLVLTAFITNRLGKEAKGHGVPEVISAVNRKDGVIRTRIVFLKMIASALCIGSGGSVGREGPIVQIGSALGSALGQFFNMSRTNLCLLVGCGAAAGISATFNAPLAGAVFASEIILGEISLKRISPLLIASLVANSIARVYLGNDTAFLIPKYELASYWELILYCILGLFSGLAALLFIKVLYKTEDIFRFAKIHWMYKAVIGGLLLGTASIFVPEILGVGYGTIDVVLTNSQIYSIEALVLMFVLKLVMTSITLGAGGSGGIFAPSLFIGAMLGGIFGLIAIKIPYFDVAPPAAYALVGMGALVAGATQAPIQAILILFEMTDNYQIILPIMLSCVISKMVTKKIGSGSIYTIKLLRRGEPAETENDIRVLKRLRVDDVMESNYKTTLWNTSFNETIRLMRETNVDELTVINEQGEFMGIVEFEQIRKILLNNVDYSTLVISDLIEVKYQTIIHLDDNLLDVFYKMRFNEIKWMPVVDKSNRKKLLGIVTRHNLMAMYKIESLLKQENYHA